MKTLLLFAIGACALIAFTVKAQPTTNLPVVRLTWDTHPDLSVTGYKVYQGVAPRSYTNAVPVAGRTNATITIPNLARGVTFYWAVTATNAAGLESDYSAEVSYTTTTLPAPPQNFRLTVLSP